MRERQAGGATALVRALIVGQYALIAAYCVTLVLPERLQPSSAVGLVLVNLVFVPAAVLLALRAGRSPVDRGWTTALAAGLTAYLSAMLLMVVAGEDGAAGTFVDLLYVSTYVCFFVAVVLAVRRLTPRVREGMVVEALIAALGAAAFSAALLHPFLEAPATAFTDRMATVVVPMIAVLLLSTVVGAVALSAGFLSRAQLGMSGGLGLFVLTDLVHVRQSLLGVYHLGDAVDVGWSLGAALMAHGAWSERRRRNRDPRSSDVRASLLVTTVSGWAATGLLVIGALLHLPWYAVILAAAALLLGMVRTAQAIWRLQDLARLRREVGTDELTGLLSRRAFYDVADDLLDESASAGGGVGVGILDLDRFKEVNDRWGHEVGDRVLATFGERVTAAAATSPARVLVARLGGDEFAFVVTGVTHEADLLTVGQLVAEAARIDCGEESDVVEVTASVGLALSPRHGTERSELLRCADLAMYAAKRAGRDRVVVFGPYVAPPPGVRPLVRG